MPNLDNGINKGDRSTTITGSFIMTIRTIKIFKIENTKTLPSKACGVIVQVGRYHIMCYLTFDLSLKFPHSAIYLDVRINIF